MLCDYYNQLKKTAKGWDIEGILEIVAKRRDRRGVYIIVERRGKELDLRVEYSIILHCYILLGYF
jgi:hypothetical protein